MQTVALENLDSLAREVLARLPKTRARAAVVALSGDLGAGKTTFTQALARALGIAEPVQSPTYVLMRSYPMESNGFTKLLHIDAYRLAGAAEFAALRPEEFLRNPHNLVVVEWPERAGEALPAPDVVLRFSADGAGERERYIELI